MVNENSNEAELRHQMYFSTPVLALFVMWCIGGVYLLHQDWSLLNRGMERGASFIYRHTEAFLLLPGPAALSADGITTAI